MKDWSIIILAAGKGTRMGGSVPKPLAQLGGKPLIAPIIHNSLDLGFKEIIVLISSFTEQIKEVFPDPRLRYIMVEPVGTGGGTLEALKHVTSPNVIVAQADDSYFYTPEMLRRLTNDFEQRHVVFSVGVCEVTENMPYAWAEFDADHTLIAIHKTEHDLHKAPPKHVVAGLYAGDAKWMVAQLERVPVNGKGEIPLPPIIDYGLADGQKIAAFEIPPQEWRGINTPEELAKAKRLLDR